MQTNGNIIAATLIVIAAVSTLWIVNYRIDGEEVVVNQLDLTCGFTDDFSAFLKSSSNCVFS